MRFEEFADCVLRVDLTPAQRVLARVGFDAVEPCDLTGAARDHARQLFGDVYTVPLEARGVFAVTKGARAGGTWLCSLFLLYRAFTASCAGLAAGELGFCPIVAPDMRLARQGLRYAAGAAMASPDLARFVAGRSSDSLTIRRPDGYSVVVTALPATRGGSALRGRTLLAGLMDESAFFRDGDSGEINDSELFRALAVRIVADGVLCVISTAWLESGLLHDLVRQNLGSPSSALACVAPTELMRPDSPKIRAVVEAERVRDPLNAAREFDCVPFTGGAGAYFDRGAISDALDDNLPCPVALDSLSNLGHWVVGAGYDFAARQDAAAGVVVAASSENRPSYVVCSAFERRPAKGKPLVPSVVTGGFCQMVRDYGGSGFSSDAFYLEAVREAATSHDLQLYQAPGGQMGKARSYGVARELLHAGRIRIPSTLTRLAVQLGEVVSQPTTGGGLKITSPRRGGAHGDLVSAFVLALWHASRSSSTVGAQSGGDPGSMHTQGGAFGYVDDPECWAGRSVIVCGTRTRLPDRESSESWRRGPY